MSTKKYLSLEEAAQQLGLRNDELNKLREQGQIRGFADRGTWKFKIEDVQELGRTRQADSDPELPMFDEPLGSPDSALSLGGESAMVLDDEGSDDPTVIRKSSDPLRSSDSDVRLVFDEPLPVGPTESNQGMAESDSDVRLVGNLLPESDSDSDIKLVGDNLDSDSDVKLVGDATVSDFTLAKGVASQKGSDSDIRLVPPDSDSDVKIVKSDLDSDSDVKLVTPDMGSDSDVKVIRSSDTSDSDVQLLGAADSSIALDFTPDDSESASVLSEESGIALGGDSAMMLATESGLTLEGPSDSAIGLSAESDEGITLDTSSSVDSGISLGSSDSGISLSLGDSGISLETVGDSGISLEDSGDFSGTIPMMDVAKDLDNVPETKFEIPAIKSDDSAFELRMDDEGNSNESTQVLNLQDSGEATLDDAVFDVEDDDAIASGDDDDLEVEEDAFADDDDAEDLDVFGADDDAFADEGDGGARPIAARGGIAYEHEWSGGVVGLLMFTSVVLSLCMFLMFDLVKTMWVSQPGTPVASALLQSLGGLFGTN